MSNIRAAGRHFKIGKPKVCCELKCLQKMPVTKKHTKGTPASSHLTFAVSSSCSHDHLLTNIRQLLPALFYIFRGPNLAITVLTSKPSFSILTCYFSNLCLLLFWPALEDQLGKFCCLMKENAWQQPIMGAKLVHFCFLGSQSVQGKLNAFSENHRPK